MNVKIGGIYTINPNGVCIILSEIYNTCVLIPNDRHQFELTRDSIIEYCKCQKYCFIKQDIKTTYFDGYLGLVDGETLEMLNDNSFCSF